MKKLVLLTVASFVFICSHAAGDWEILQQYAELKVYFKKIQCDDATNGIFQEKVILKFENLTNQQLDFKFAKKLWYDGKPSTSENTFSIHLTPKQTSIGSCETKDKGLTIFSRFTKMKQRELTKFEVVKIELTTHP